MLPFGDFLNTKPLSVPWISSTKGANLTLGIVHSLRLIDVPRHIRELSREMREGKET
jgi:hypothetical protein